MIDYGLYVTEYGLSVINYGLFVIDYSLSMIDYGLSVIYYSLSVIDYGKSVISFGLSVIDYDLDLNLKNCHALLLAKGWASLNFEHSQVCPCMVWECLHYFNCSVTD